MDLVGKIEMFAISGVCNIESLLYLPRCFAAANTFFQLNLVFVADIRTGFCSRLV